MRAALLICGLVAACAAHEEAAHSMDDHDHSAHSMPDSMPTDAHAGGGHPTSFRSDFHSVELLFSGWCHMTAWQYGLSLVALVLFGVFSESLAVIERKLSLRFFPMSAKEVDPVASESISTNHRVLRTMFYTIRTTVHFLLMLASMTFDVGIFIAIMAGFGVGFFFFSSAHASASPSAGHVHA